MLGCMEATGRHGLDLEHHQLDRRYEHLRLRRAAVEERLMGSLSSRGQQVPVVVVAGDSPHRYRVIDGFHRIRALERLGEDTVWAVEWRLSDLDALLLDRGLRSASETIIEQAWLLFELAERFALDGEELARRFDRSPSWISRRLALVQVLPEQVQEWIREGRISGHTAMRHLVPLARAKPDFALEVASAVARQKLSCRQVGQLVRLLRNVSREHRPRILANPELALRARQESRAPAPRERNWLVEVESLAERIRWLSRHVPSTLDRDARRRALEALDAGRQALDGCRESLGEDESLGEQPC